MLQDCPILLYNVFLLHLGMHGRGNQGSLFTWLCIQSTKCKWEQGWQSSESTRLPPMWPGFDSRTQRHMWVEFVVGSRPCSEGFFLGSPVFLPPQKPTFQIPIQPGKSGRIATLWIWH